MACLPNLYKPLLFLLIIFASTAFSSKNITIHEDKIVFGAGCFWSVEKKFAELPGVINVESGYADGIGLEPRYSEITKFKNKFNPDNFAEVVEVTYDRNSISLTDLIKFFFELHDPTQKNRQGNDIGTQYRSLILFNDQSDEMLSIELKDEYQKLLSKEGYGDIVTNIKKLKKFYPAEEYHQDYLVKNPNGYCPDHSTGIVFEEVEKPKIDNSYLLAGKYILVLDSEFCPYCTKLKNEVLSDYEGSIPLHYRYSSDLHDLQLSSPTWATPTIFFIEDGVEKFSLQGFVQRENFYKALGIFKLGESEAYSVAFNQGTPEGVFIDKLSGAPLFDTKDRFNSRTGWLSFTKPVDGSVTEHMDYSYGMTRVEIKSKSSGIHLGHVFQDGPNGLPRYCINATVLEFVPRNI
jgi:peptide methionine sulfoxide reductase msrA/msrB